MQRGPTHAGGDGRLVKFALDHVLGAAVIEAEDLIIDVKSIHDRGQAVPHSHATLGIELEVCVEVVVAQRAGYAAISAVGEPVTSDIRSVIRQADAHGDTATAVSRPDVPSMGCVPHQATIIATLEHAPPRPTRHLLAP